MKLAALLNSLATPPKPVEGRDVTEGDYDLERRIQEVMRTPHTRLQITSMIAAHRANSQAEIIQAIEPVKHWYQCDEEDARPLVDIITDIVTDLQNDRENALKLKQMQTKLDAAKEALGAIIDRGPERDKKYTGMTLRDIAIQALALIDE